MYLLCFILFVRSCEDVLGPDDYKNIFQFVYCSHRPLATVAGEFLYNRLVACVKLSVTGIIMYICGFKIGVMSGLLGCSVTLNYQSPGTNRTGTESLF